MSDLTRLRFVPSACGLLGGKLPLLVVCIVWLIPFFWAGWHGRVPVPLPRRLSFQYNAAALFTKRTGTWQQFIIQARYGSTAQWTTVDTQQLSPMGAFGYRQRIDRILQECRTSRAAGDVGRRLASWIAERLSERGRPTTGIRFIILIWPVTIPEMTAPSGHWTPWPDSLSKGVTTHIWLEVPINAPTPTGIRTPDIFKRK